MVRPWPASVEKKGTTKAFSAQFRKAFDADPESSYSAGEINGVIIVVARAESHVAHQIRRFVRDDLGGIIQRRVEQMEDPE